MGSSNGKSSKSFTEILTSILLIVGFFTTLVAFMINLSDWSQDPQTIRYASIAGFVLYFIGSVWFAWTAQVSSWWRWSSLIALYVVSALYFGWVGTWFGPGSPSIVDVDIVSGLNLGKDDMGSTIQIQTVTGKSKPAVMISYNLKPNGWVTFSKVIESGKLLGTEKVRFLYQAIGAPNTIELKYIFGDDKQTTFGVLWNSATVSPGKAIADAPYRLFNCWWPADGCQYYGNKLDLKNVKMIEFAISNKPGDIPGAGNITIEGIQGIKYDVETSSPVIIPSLVR